MLFLSGFELYSRWMPLNDLREVKTTVALYHSDPATFYNVLVWLEQRNLPKACFHTLRVFVSPILKICSFPIFSFPSSSPSSRGCSSSPVALPRKTIPLDMRLFRCKNDDFLEHAMRLKRRPQVTYRGSWYCNNVALFRGTYCWCPIS